MKKKNNKNNKNSIIIIKITDKQPMAVTWPMAFCGTLQLQLCACLVHLFKTKAQKVSNKKIRTLTRVGALVGSIIVCIFFWFLF
jgi:hypothetical protein